MRIFALLPDVLTVRERVLAKGKQRLHWQKYMTASNSSKIGVGIGLSPRIGVSLLQGTRPRRSRVGRPNEPNLAQP
jgi:hypothetical protein